jgi:hypothetical protein
VDVVRRGAAPLADLVERADADQVVGVVDAAPDRQRRPPVALAGERPVDVVLEPLAEAAVLDVRRVPVDRLVRCEQLVAALGGAHVPVRLGVVDERRAAAPAVRVGVGDLAGAEQAAGLAQRLDDVRVGLADVHPGERAGALVEAAVAPHRVVDREAVLLGQAEVVLAERGAGVDHAGAVLDRDEVARQHGVPARTVVRDVGEGRLVAQAQQGRAGHPLLDLGVLAEHPRHQRLGEDQPVVAEPRPHVRDLRVDRDGRVRHERPGHRRPGQQRDARVVEQRELDVHGRVDRVLVAERDLVARQRRAVARAVGHHLVALGQQALLPDLLERPPDRLDVGVVEREVGVAGVDPEADPLGQLVPLVDVAEHRLAALRVELGDPVALDVVLALDAELLLDLELDREPVAVPAGLAGNEVPLHGLVAGEDVLEDARQDVVRARPPVGGRRTLVEDEAGRPLAAADRLVEDVALAPALEHALLERGERLRGIDGPVAGH